jgi:hypothetical protein
MAVDQPSPFAISSHQELMGLTGRKQLAAERTEFDRMIGAIQRVLATT